VKSSRSSQLWKTFQGKSSPPRTPRSRMLQPNRWLPPLMKELPIRKDHGLVFVAGHLTECTCAQMAECAKALIAMCRDAPPSLPDAVGQIRLIPLDWAECFVQSTDLIQTRAPHGPGTDHDVDLRDTEPIPRCVSDGGHHVFGQMEVLPARNGSL